MAYVTASQVADYMGIPVGDLPSNINKLINDAEDFLNCITLDRIQTRLIDPDTGDFREAKDKELIMKAAAAQIEYWINTDIESDIEGQVESFTVGKFSMKYAKGGKPVLAPRANRFLFLTGVLYRGITRYPSKGYPIV